MKAPRLAFLVSMRVLIVHQNFPAQYKHIAPALVAQGHEVTALATDKRNVPAGVRVVYHCPERGTSPQIHTFASDFETKTIRAESAARVALKLKVEGYRPDVICAHPGWGETMFLSEVFPDAPMLSFMEFYFQRENADFSFEASATGASPPPDEAYWRARARNAPFLLALDASTWCVSPTRWQWSQLPPFARAMTSIIHDGVDTQAVRPRPETIINLGRGGQLRPGDEVITFVNRNLEPYRGYHTFMRALPEILRRRPKARAVIVGGNGVSYGAAAPAGKTWREIYLAEVASQLDMSRVHFVGNVPYNTYVQLLQVSAAHVYLTYPFVLSWSMLEAMSAGCLVIGSRTPPVEEVIEDGHNGFLVDFFKPEEVAARVIAALEKPLAFRDVRRAARKTVVDRYDLRTVCLPQHLDLIDRVARGELPAPVT
jgi:glycosyltransferase involved in cell wall biosynthesis